MPKKPAPATRPRRQHGQCPDCRHYGIDCHCHRRRPPTDEHLATTHGWTKARIGCYWTRGPYGCASVTSIRPAAGTEERYYEVTRHSDHRVIGKAQTWTDVERIADRRSGKDRRGTR